MTLDRWLGLLSWWSVNIELDPGSKWNRWCHQQHHPPDFKDIRRHRSSHLDFILKQKQILIHRSESTVPSTSTSTGVPQGCVSAPLLFTLYTNERCRTFLSVAQTHKPQKRKLERCGNLTISRWWEGVPVPSDHSLFPKPSHYLHTESAAVTWTASKTGRDSPIDSLFYYWEVHHRECVCKVYIYCLFVCYTLLHVVLLLLYLSNISTDQAAVGGGTSICRFRLQMMSPGQNGCSFFRRSK